jgi:hypothetical protein
LTYLSLFHFPYIYVVRAHALRAPRALKRRVWARTRKSLCVRVARSVLLLRFKL